MTVGTFFCVVLLALFIIYASVTAYSYKYEYDEKNEEEPDDDFLNDFYNDTETEAVGALCLDCPVNLYCKDRCNAFNKYVEIVEFEKNKERK